MQAEHAVTGVAIRIGTRDIMREGYVAVALGSLAVCFGVVPATALGCAGAAVAGVALAVRVRLRAGQVPGRVGARLGWVGIVVGLLGVAVSTVGLLAG